MLDPSQPFQNIRGYWLSLIHIQMCIRDRYTCQQVRTYSRLVDHNEYTHYNSSLMKDQQHVQIQCKNAQKFLAQTILRFMSAMHTLIFTLLQQMHSFCTSQLKLCYLIRLRICDCLSLIHIQMCIRDRSSRVLTVKYRTSASAGVL